MKSITIAGNIGKNAEARTTGSGDSVTSFSVAVNAGKDKPPMWFSVSIWGRRGTALQPYLTKGSKVVVCGDFFADEKDGKTYLNVRADQVTPFFGGERREEPQRDNADPFGLGEDSDIPF